MKIRLPRPRLQPVTPQALRAAMQAVGLASLVLFCLVVWPPLALLVAGALLLFLAEGVTHDDAAG